MTRRWGMRSLIDNELLDRLRANHLLTKLSQTVSRRFRPPTPVPARETDFKTDGSSVSEHMQGSPPAGIPGAPINDIVLVPISDLPTHPLEAISEESSPSSDIKPNAPVPLDTFGLEGLSEIRKFASWCSADGERELKRVISLFRERYPGNDEEIEKTVVIGRFHGSLFAKALELGKRGGTSKEAEQLLASLNGDTPQVVTRIIRERYQKGLLVFSRLNNERKRQQLGQRLTRLEPCRLKPAPTTLPNAPLVERRLSPANNVPGLHSNDFRILSPASHWQLIIDETGSAFDETAMDAISRRIGRFVGILVPLDNNTLPPLSCGWHAVDCSDTDEIDGVVQAVLDAPVGVLGIDVLSLPLTSGERWLDGVALLIDWTLRLMPINTPCKLEVKVEQRGVFQKGQTWDVVRRDCLRRLALAFPARAAKFDLQIDVITKTGTQFNGYADAIAFTWAGTTASSKARLKCTGWEGTCLLSSTSNLDARSMLYAWDAFTQGVNLPPALWWDMASSPVACSPAALMNALLNLVGNETQVSPPLWNVFLNEVKTRMAAAPVDLQRLAAAIDWLRRYQPADAAILPAMQLVWLTVQLARANHIGKIEQEWQAELERLGDQLFDEGAPLVCHADLHRAVEATNRYDFTGAQQALARWQNRPPSEPGLRYWGQLQSSFGQHAAFLGDNTGAIGFFKEALNAFARLSDPEARIQDSLQTGCYLAIASMDDTIMQPLAVRAAVEKITGALPEAAARLAASNGPDERYAHHLLLRWLVHRGDEQTRQAYLDRRDEWDADEGHPWPLIQIYRAILLHDTDPAAACKLALDGAERAFRADQGPTVRLIGVCCRVVALAWGVPWGEGDQELDRINKQIPAAAERTERLRAALHKTASPLDLLTTVLPFNFR